jgi:hypothetical protein
MSKSYYLQSSPAFSAFTRFTAGLYLVFADVMVTNQQTGTLRVVTSILSERTFKNMASYLLCFWTTS